MDGTSGARREPSHKAMRQRLERLESSLNAVPQAMEECLDGLEAHCTAGVKLASLLETVFQDSPLLLLALRYKEACEKLLDKSSSSGLAMKQEVVVPLKRLGPALSRLRTHIDSHAKASARHEGHLRQLEGLTLSGSASRSKVESVEGRFRASAQEFADEDQQLAEALRDLQQLRTELMGGCFLSYLEAVSKVTEVASDLLAPLGAYKELRHGLRESPSSSVLQEATVSWLAATQVNQNLRSFGGLSRNDVQCMLYNHPDGLPETIRTGLNNKVNQLIKLYSSELQKVETPNHVVIGGFHYSPKAIELALKDCCSELEAKAAGADHAHTPEAQAEQITRDVSRTRYKIGGRQFGAATGEAVVGNIAEKQSAVVELISSLRAVSGQEHSPQLLQDFAEHVLNESCTTVTNTAAKTAVQLVFGKANLVLVRPSPSAEDNRAIEIAARQSDSTVVITVLSSWWLVEDYAAFAVLQRLSDPDAVLGVVDAVYSIALSLDSYCRDNSGPELPTVSVTYRQPASSADTLPQPAIGSKEKERLLSSSMQTLRNKFRTFQKSRGRVSNSDSPQRLSISPRQASLKTYVDESGGVEGEEEEEGKGEGKHSNASSRKPSTDSESVSEAVPHSAGYSSVRYSSSRSDSFGRGVRPPYHRHGPMLKRSESSDTLSSQSTLVPRPSFLESDDHPLGIADLIHDSHRPTLTQSRVWAHDASRHRQQMYHHYNQEMQKPRKDGRAKGGEEEEEREGEGKDEDGKTIEGSPGSAEISIASDVEMERVLTFLSNKPGAYDEHYQRYQDGHREDGYGYKYGYSSREFGGPRISYPDTSEMGKGSNSSSDSSGVDDHFSRGSQRSRSGSVTSFHADHDGGKEAVGGREREEGGEEVGGHRVQSGSNASLMSMDSGIGAPPPVQQKFVGEREMERARQGAMDNGHKQLHSQELPFDFSKGLGPLIPTDPRQQYGMDDYRMFSALGHSGRDSVPSSSSGSQSPVMFRARSEENIRALERSASRSSTHSMPYLPHAHGSNTSLDNLDFDHTPGSRPHPFDYEQDRLSQDSLEGPPRPYWDYRQKPPHEQFGPGPYNYNVPRGAPYNYDGDYQEPLPPHMHERHSRPMQRGMRGRSEDYSPSPGPPLDRRHQPPPYWPGAGYDGGFDHAMPRGGPPLSHQPGPMPPPGPGLHPPGLRPPGLHPMPDNRFRPVPFRPTTPSSPSPASMHSMSPAPSPHPTPPPTPPPPHGLPRPPPPHGPPMPGHYHSPRGHMHPPHRDYPPRDFRPPPPPAPPSQPGAPHNHPGPLPPRGPMLGPHPPPPPFGLTPSPGPPPVSMPGRFPPGPSWERPWGHH